MLAVGRTRVEEIRGSLGTRWWILIQFSGTSWVVEEGGTGSCSLKGFNWKGSQLRPGTRARGLSRRDGWSLALAVSLSRRERF